MAVRANFFKKAFIFNFPARTSRGLMKDKTSWFIRLYNDRDTTVFGIGECGPLPGLSVDHHPAFEETLQRIVQRINQSPLSVTGGDVVHELVPPEYPSIVFGLETALLDLQHGGKRILYDNGFVQGKSIEINGLIWMGDMDFMMDQINKKVHAGFTCLKLKVGGLDFDRECDVLAYIRKKYFRQKLTIRLDANGAFKSDDALYKLRALARYQIHSIEQPIKPRLAEMEELCLKSPIPVAFDEELIGVYTTEDKSHLLEKLKPHFIVLKPTLHGGLNGCKEWIALAGARNIGWWITSALESSIGLNAICQFTANYDTTLPQGLGTGAIYKNNFPSPLAVKQGRIFYDVHAGWGGMDLDASRA